MLGRLLIRIVSGVVLAAAGLMLMVYVVVSGSLPQLDGITSTSTISDDVLIERDSFGIPTITASNRVDLAFATGFVHAQDRFFQMDLTRRKSAGELSALVGEIALPLDKTNRLHRFRTRAKAIVAASSDADHDLMEAYAAGVNASLFSLDNSPFEYYLLRADPEPWQLEDSILVAFTMFLELNDERATRDVQRGMVRSSLPEPVYQWLFPKGTRWDAPIVGGPRRGPGFPSPEVFNVRERDFPSTGFRMRPADEQAIAGSNNWAVSGELTASGRAIVANDIHLRLSTPNVFYRARLVVEGENPRDVSGVTLPGVPVVITGSNGMVAWAFTNSYGDWSDAVLVRPGNEPGTYVTADGLLEFDVYDESIAVNGSETVDIRIRETVWGPVRDDIKMPDAEIAISWIAHYPDAVNLVHSELELAATVTEALATANRLGVPPQNFVAGDADGNIGWTIAGRVPVRTGFDPWLPADWSEENGWQGWLDPEQYPRVINPASGRIWTANSRVVEGDALKKIGDGGYDLGARATQIRDNLMASDEFTPSDMLQIQLDDRALFLQRWRDLLLDILDDDAVKLSDDRRHVRDLVESWVPNAKAGSVGYRMVRSFRTEVRALVFAMLTEPVVREFALDNALEISNQFEGSLWQLVNEQPMHLLTADYPGWKSLMLQAVDNNIAYFHENYDGNLGQRNWGERNTAHIRHPLSGGLPLLSAWLDMPYEPLDGDSNMPRVASPAFGSTERFSIEVGDEANSLMHMPTGQSGHPLSDYYGNGHEAWVRGLEQPFLPGDTRHTLKLSASQ